MPKTRRDLLIAMRGKLSELFKDDPAMAKLLETRRRTLIEAGALPFADGEFEGPAGRAMRRWLETEISDEEYEKHLSTPLPSAKALKTLLDPMLFPAASESSSSGKN